MPDRETIIDFHCHHVSSSIELTNVKHLPLSQRARWLATNKLISDERLLLKDIESDDIQARVVNTPTAQIADADGTVSLEIIMKVNDGMAELASRHRGKIYSLATIDPYSGDIGAREAERAIRELGLSGIFVDCARGELLIDDIQARPTLQVASRLGVPVFVHPINPMPLIAQMDPYGRLGTLFARGSVNGASLIALVESNVFDEFPDLKIVITTLGIGGLATLSAFSALGTNSDRIKAILRKNIYLDTMGFDPALIRMSIDILGPSKILVGSDWPIVNDGQIRNKILNALDAADVPKSEQALILAKNTLSLLRH